MIGPNSFAVVEVSSNGSRNVTEHHSSAESDPPTALTATRRAPGQQPDRRSALPSAGLAGAATSGRSRRRAAVTHMGPVQGRHNQSKFCTVGRRFITSARHTPIDPYVHCRLRRARPVVAGIRRGWIRPGGAVVAAS